MYRHGVRIWVVAFGPEEVCEELGDGQGRSNLSEFGKEVETEVSPCADGNMTLEILTAKQKNRRKNAISKNGTSNHPTPFKTAKNPISIGSVTRKSVPMTSFRLGFLLPSSHPFGDDTDGRADAVE